ncbi:MAG: metal ABC transporter ATP-binding protein [Solobacterium sp.]|nr:metal ABC transporter ATP-binding protein [Solobacterium sp.]
MITCRNLTLGYDGQAIIKDLNFTVKRGDYLCIIGENGSGKTTLMKTMLGLLRPLSGDIVFDEGLTAGTIGYLPQRTDIQKDFPATVKEVVLSGCLKKLGRRWFYSAADRQLAAENMARMGIADLADKSCRQLSGGQLQRVLLARALCAADQALVLDEPVTGLDPQVTADLYRLIEELNRAGVTIIMISHDLGAALKYATHILSFSDRIFFGTRQEFTALMGQEAQA